MQSAQESYTLDDIGYSNLISCLESMTPFEAIRQAEEINKVNGFEVVSKIVIAEWKREARNEKLKSGISKIENQKIEIKKIEMVHGESRYMAIEKKESVLNKRKSEIKKFEKTKYLEYQKALMKLLNL